MTTSALRLLTADARNRALRSFIQGLAVDVGVAVAFVVYDATSSDEPDYRLLWATLIKTALQTAAAYVMRRFVDPSRVPTPLPPNPPGEPDDDQPDAGEPAVEDSIQPLAAKKAAPRKKKAP